MKRLFLYLIYTILSIGLSSSGEMEAKTSYESLDILNKRLDITVTRCQLSLINIEVIQRAFNVCNGDDYPIAKFHLMNTLAFFSGGNYVDSVGLGCQMILFNLQSIKAVMGSYADDTVCDDLAFQFNRHGVSDLFARQFLVFKADHNRCVVEKILISNQYRVRFPVCILFQKTRFAMISNSKLYKENYYAIGLLRNFLQSYGFINGESNE